MYHVINEMENNISTVMKNKLNPDQNIESLENDTDAEDVVEEYVAEYETLNNTIDQVDTYLNNLESQNDLLYSQLQQLLVSNQEARQQIKSEQQTSTEEQAASDQQSTSKPLSGSLSEPSTPGTTPTDSQINLLGASVLQEQHHTIQHLLETLVVTDISDSSEMGHTSNGPNQQSAFNSQVIGQTTLGSEHFDGISDTAGKGKVTDDSTIVQSETNCETSSCEQTGSGATSGGTSSCEQTGSGATSGETSSCEQTGSGTTSSGTTGN